MAELTPSIYNTEKIYKISDVVFPRHPFILIASARRSGKTVIMRDIVFNLLKQYEYDAIILFSETAYFEQEYSFLDKTSVRTCENMESDLEKLIVTQKENKTKHKDVHLLILLDDVIITQHTKRLV